jgi:biotin carboxyl carrier protein
MELPVTAPMDGVVTQLRCTEGRSVLVAQTLLIICPDDAGAVPRATT